MRTVSINKHLKLRIMRGRAVEGLTVRDSDTSPLRLWAHAQCRRTEAWQNIGAVCMTVHISTYHQQFKILIIYKRRHMTNEICTHILHIIHNTHATWVHTARAHTTYNNATHVHAEDICVYKCESIHVKGIGRKIGPTNSYFVWTSAGMIGQDVQYESPTPYTSQRGW